MTFEPIKPAPPVTSRFIVLNTNYAKHVAEECSRFFRERNSGNSRSGRPCLCVGLGFGFPMFQRIFDGLIDRADADAGSEQLRNIQHAVRSWGFGGEAVEFFVVLPEFK